MALPLWGSWLLPHRAAPDRSSRLRSMLKKSARLLAAIASPSQGLVATRASLYFSALPT